MAYDAFLREVSGKGLAIGLDPAERLNAFTLNMGCEPIEASAPLPVDEFAGRRRAAGNAPQDLGRCAAGSSR